MSYATAVGLGALMVTIGIYDPSLSDLATQMFWPMHTFGIRVLLPNVSETNTTLFVPQN